MKLVIEFTPAALMYEITEDGLPELSKELRTWAKNLNAEQLTKVGEIAMDNQDMWHAINTAITRAIECYYYEELEV